SLDSSQRFSRIPVKFRWEKGMRLGRTTSRAKFSTDLTTPMAASGPQGKTWPMTAATQTSEPVPLLQARRQPDGGHSSKQLSSAVRRGELLRLRPGVYVHTASWTQAPPWHRYQVVIGAAALRDPALIFCRESALVLHGLPLRRVPPKVTVRTTRPGWAGTKPAPQTTGPLSSA